MNNNEIKEIGIQCLKDEAKAILDMESRIDDDFAGAVNLIHECKGKCIVTGVGKSGHIATKIAATFASTGTPSFFLNPLDAYHGDLGMVSKGDVVIAISYSGYTDELLRVLPSLINRNIPIIGISSNPQSLLARYSKYHLNIKVEREADPLNLAPTSSTTATMAMGDALACALVRIRNFSENDFAMYHPGGSLGKRLLSKVKDYMVKSDLPIVSKETKISDAIIEISKTKQGIAVAIEDGKIVGVVTDGDIRRAMQTQQSKFFSLTVGEIMSKNPKQINENEKLSSAGEMMRKHNIHTLVVTDDDNKFAGLIDAFSAIL